MGDDHIRHVLIKRSSKGERFYWNPSTTLRALGLIPEALGRDKHRAIKRAVELNALGDEMRRGAKHGGNGPLPGTVARLFAEYQASDEFLELRARTRKDYAYYLEKIETEYGLIPVAALTPKVLKVYYKAVRKNCGVVWAYHVMGTFRTVLSWAVSENWIPRNPARDVKVASPARRKVVWAPEQARAYIASAKALGWHSVAVMARVFDCTAQSPVDVRTLTRAAYDGEAVDVTRSKTGIGGAPIPLWPDVRLELDAYLETRPSLHPAAPLFVNDRTRRPWVESTLHKIHAAIRAHAGLPSELQLQDFRRTAQTEAGAGGATVDEIRALARHKTRSVGERYVMPDSRFVDEAQRKRLAVRNGTGAKVRSHDT